MTAIIVLKRKCKEYQQTGDEEQAARSYSSNAMGPPQVPAIGGPITRESSRSSSNETEQEVSIVWKLNEIKYFNLEWPTPTFSQPYQCTIKRKGYENF